MRRQRKRPGFTLVELLVVIGIIALLISILLPALGRARASANLVACQSNFKQVYGAVLFYSNDNHGLLPWVSCNPNYAAGDPWGGPSGQMAQGFVALTKYMGGTFSDETKDKLSPVFICPEALPAENGNAWLPNLIHTVRFHPRAFPGYDQQYGSQAAEYPQRKLSSIRNGSEKIAFWDSPQVTGWNMCPEPEAINLDGWRWWNWNTSYYSDPPSDGDYSRWNLPIDNSGPNTDASGWWQAGCVRYRHMLNTTTPVAFFDGHVEARKIGEIKVKDISINK